MTPFQGWNELGDILIWMYYFKNCFISRKTDNMPGVSNSPNQIGVAYWTNYFQHWRKLWLRAISNVVCSFSYLIKQKSRYKFKETTCFLCSADKTKFVEVKINDFMRKLAIYKNLGIINNFNCIKVKVKVVIS